MITDVRNELSELKDRLRLAEPSLCDKKVFAGFDGFVDKIMKAVSKKRNYDTIFMKQIGEFASRVQESAGKSGQIELVTEQVKLGGNAPILSNALGALGIKTYCFGSMGYPKVHPAFNALNKNCEVNTMLEPGQSNALEFIDGKIILSELGPFEHYDWKYISSVLGKKAIQGAIDASAVVCLVDWSNLPHGSDIWNGLLDDVIKPSGRTDFEFLFDLCDPSKKTTEQIDELLDLIGCFSSYGAVTLALNENETLRIWSAIKGLDLDIIADRKCSPDIRTAGEDLYKTMNIKTIVIHPIDRCIVLQDRKIIEFEGRLEKAPKIITGAGDNFNAGYCLGLLAKLPLHHIILLGMAAAGAYVKYGYSPDLKSLISYIDQWILDLQISLKGSPTATNVKNQTSILVPQNIIGRD